MLVLGSELINIAVMSLHTGGRVAELEEPVINPADLRILAYKVKGPLLPENPSFLRSDDIREMGPLGMIIDGADDLIGLEDVIKVKEIYELGFRLVSMPVIDEQKQKLGKVEDYAVDTSTFMIQKLRIKRGVFKSFADTGLLIDRSQVVEINHSAIIVKSTAKKVADTQETVEPAYDYINPFRKPGTVPQLDMQTRS